MDNPLPFCYEGEELGAFRKSKENNDGAESTVEGGGGGGLVSFVCAGGGAEGGVSVGFEAVSAQVGGADEVLQSCLLRSHRWGSR